MMYQRWRKVCDKIIAGQNGGTDASDDHGKAEQRKTGRANMEQRQTGCDVDRMTKTMELLISTGDYQGMVKFLSKPPPREQRKRIEEKYKNKDPVIHALERWNGKMALLLIGAGFSYRREYTESFFFPCFRCCQCDHGVNPWNDCINGREEDTAISATFLAKHYGIREVEEFINDADAGIYDSEEDSSLYERGIGLTPSPDGDTRRSCVVYE